LSLYIEVVHKRSIPRTEFALDLGPVARTLAAVTDDRVF
jgi:hypothetical protein